MKKNNKNIQVKKIIKIIGLSAFIILAITAIIFSLSIFKLNMLPTKYIILLNVVLLLILFGIFLLAYGKTKKKNIIATCISVILSIGFIIGTSFILKTNSTLANFFKNENEKIKYHLVVEKTSEYNDIKDLKDLNIGILRENSVNVKEFLETKSLVVKIYDTLGILTQSLGTTNQAIILNDNMLESLKELDPEFNEKIITIGNFTLELGKDVEKTADEEEEPPRELTEEEKQAEEERKRLEEEMAKRKEELKNLNKGNSFIVYISGIDASGGNNAANSGLSDVNMLLVINPDKNKMLMVSIPRDYYVYINGKKDKLTHAGLYGINTSVKTLENLFEVKIDYYLKVCFGAVTTLVDDIDGIEVYSDTAFNSSHYPGWYVNVGMNQMNGRKALAYSRERYAYASGDRHRAKNQQDVIDAIVKKVSTNSSYLLKFNDILNDVNPYVATSIPYSKMQELVRKQINTLSGWSVTKYSVDGYNSFNYSASFPSAKAYVMEPNYQTVMTAQDKIINAVK